jgi:proline dehydrogenase
MKWLQFFARRFVAGETAAEAVAAADALRAKGVRAIIDYLGEHVDSEAEASAAVEEYRGLIRLIAEKKVDASISLKASQMGIGLSVETCQRNLAAVAAAAREHGITLWIDMEGSNLTQKTIDAFDELRGRYANVGLCLQAYLVRTGGDIDRLMRVPFKVRLCKGAYKEPASIAYASRKAVDGSYRMLASKLLDGVPRGTYPAFATHDRTLIQDILQQARQKGVAPDQFEFEMLYGIQNRALESLAERGYRTQVYVPYGHAWLPYFIRRLRERKENVYFLLRNLIGR